jgi:hypothetical protein
VEIEKKRLYLLELVGNFVRISNVGGRMRLAYLWPLLCSGPVVSLLTTGFFVSEIKSFKQVNAFCPNGHKANFILSTSM